MIKEIFAPHSHDAADSVDDTLESTAAGIRTVKISLLVLGLTALIQIVIVVMSGSVALAADTIHNFADALTRCRCGSRSRWAPSPPLADIPTDSVASRTWPGRSWSR